MNTHRLCQSRHSRNNFRRATIAQAGRKNQKILASAAPYSLYEYWCRPSYNQKRFVHHDVQCRSSIGVRSGEAQYEQRWDVIVIVRSAGRGARHGHVLLEYKCKYKYK
eukprot:scaffold3521_cov42-Attheya_sp.AAC.1